MNVDMLTNGSQPLQKRINNEYKVAAMDRNMTQNVILADIDGILEAKEKEINLSGLNDASEPLRTNLEFVYHEKPEKYYVTVVDQATDEVLKEIPPEKMLDMYVSMAEFMEMLVDEKV